MSDPISALAAHDAATRELDTAKEAVRDRRAEVAVALAEVIEAAKASGDPRLVEPADGLAYCNDRIDELTDDETTGVKALRAAAAAASRSLREAAKSGDARAAEAALALIEEDLADRLGEIREIRSAAKAHREALFGALRGTF